MKGKQPEIMKMPEPYASASDKFMKMDRLWFEEHPKRTNYVRESIVFEWVQDCDAPYVHVIEIEPGARVRIPIFYKTQFSEQAHAESMSVRDYVMDLMRNKLEAVPAESVRRLYTKHQN